MHLIEYQVLLPKNFWDCKSKDDLKRMVEQYFIVGYPHCEIQ